MGKLVQVQLGEHRSIYYYDLNEIECHRGDYVILEVERGSEFGRLVSDIDVEEHTKPEGGKKGKHAEQDSNS